MTTNSAEPVQPAVGQQGDKRDASRRNVYRGFFVATVQLACFAYLSVCLALMAMETRMVYPGAYRTVSHHISSDQSIAGEAEIVTVGYSASDGTRLSSRLLDRPDHANIVIFFHGNASKAIWLDDWIRRLSDSLDATVLAAEYRGYGNDSTTPKEAGLIADSLAARDYICEKYQVDADQVILWGRSLGGACAVAVAADGGAKSLVLERTFERLVDISADMYPMIPVRLLMRNRYDSIERLSRYQGPLIQLHGDADRLIPIANARNLFESAPTASKHWIEMPGIGHNDPFPEYAMSKLASLIGELTK